MKTKDTDILFTITVDDLQDVAMETLGRELSKREVDSVKNELVEGEYFDKYTLLEEAIRIVIGDDSFTRYDNLADNEEFDDFEEDY